MILVNASKNKALYMSHTLEIVNKIKNKNSDHWSKGHLDLINNSNSQSSWRKFGQTHLIISSVTTSATDH